MKKFVEMMKQNWVVLSVLAIVLVAALVIGIVAIAGGGEKEPNPSEGTSSTVATDPTATTGGDGNDVTDPTVTDPTTGTPENPDKPDDPETPDDYTEPTEPDETVPEPTEPEPDAEPDPTDPTAPKPDDDPIVGVEYDFGGYTISTFTWEVWNAWDTETREAFVDAYFIDATPEEYHHFMRQTKYKGYSCGYERHTCGSESTHNTFMEVLADGCEYCGKSDCDSFFVVDPKTLFTKIDVTKCPEYDAHKDPGEYCQTCGLPHHGEPGDTICLTCIAPTHCPYCGASMEVGECHHCTQPADD